MPPFSATFKPASRASPSLGWTPIATTASWAGWDSPPARTAVTQPLPSVSKESTAAPKTSFTPFAATL